jgi:predicted DNA-binding ArsR family transcriptional regulator
LLYIFATCPYLLETLPSLAIDKRKPEDADTTGADHACDALRYLCKARLIDAKWEQAEAARQPGVIVLADYVNKVRKRQKQARI